MGWGQPQITQIMSESELIRLQTTVKYYSCKLAIDLISE
jgi:hypothetical protein